MFNRLRSMGVAGGGGMVLVLSLSGVVAAASILTAVAAPVVDPTEPAVVDTTATFEDINGNGIDDDCETNVVEIPGAADAAKAAADLNADGQISVSEAAQIGWTGGKNCNHGGYVSGVAQDLGSDETTDATETTDTTVPPVCEAPVAPAVAALDTEPIPLVRDVAHDKTAVGGKNCNHGGAVSEAAHAANAARAAARDAAKAARAADRAAKQLNKTHGKAHRG